MPDWNDALHGWRRLDPEAKRAAHAYLATINSDNPARLMMPTNYIRKQAWTRTEVTVVARAGPRDPNQANAERMARVLAKMEAEGR